MSQNVPSAHCSSKHMPLHGRKVNGCRATTPNPKGPRTQIIGFKYNINGFLGPETLSFGSLDPVLAPIYPHIPLEPL